MTLVDLWLWFVAVPALHQCAVAFGCLTFAGMVIWIMIAVNDGEARWNLKLGVLVFFILTIACAILPNDRQAMLLAGGYALSNNAEIAKLPTNIAAAANAYLQEVTDSAKEDNKHD